MKKEDIMQQTEQDHQQNERDRRLAKAVEKCGGPGKAVPPTRTGFELWWYNIGSGIGVKPGDDYEEHAKRVAQAAWEAAQPARQTRTEHSEAYIKQAAALCQAHMDEWADRLRAAGEPGWSEEHKKRMVYWTLDSMLFEAAFGKCETREKEKQS